jgi:predicted nucleic acid-binding protein
MNASPVILLAKAEVIYIVPQLCDELVIPTGVVSEIQSGAVADAGRNWLDEIGKRFVRTAPPIPAVLAEWHGGAGEAEVMAWALAQSGFTVVLDDLKARSKARTLGLAVIGTVGIILRAKQRGLISSAKPALERLRGAGAHLSDSLINRAIELANEV